ncbi:hypothetical protein CVT25_009547 [Psilocybe cyanescens]|uniref:Uncharacterized protein n=1 Tax=Psilocybe cyanescens TaxID=93625 RepID=A0A409XV34_PSICY|nr:hypothetical protein CVT25_009547 [Psilocybe cyanescens]
MKFTRVSTFVSVLLVGLVSNVSGAALDVFVPPITKPVAGDVWTSGQQQLVTWDVSHPPASITNRNGVLILRKDDVTTPLILAENFDILLGQIEVTVPLVVEGSDYSLYSETLETLRPSSPSRAPVLISEAFMSKKIITHPYTPSRPDLAETGANPLGIRGVDADLIYDSFKASRHQSPLIHITITTSSPNILILFTMKFTSVTTLASLLFVALSSNVSALPTNTLEQRDVFVPPILDPHAGTVWTSGQRRLVTWDTSNHPVNITNKVGRIFLRMNDLTTPLILAQNFDILQGKVQVTVPLVVEGDYQLVLFGDSGNFSPTFKIKGSGVQF